MDTTHRTESVSTADGAFDALVVVPDEPNGGGVLLLQEIFGVGEFLRDRAEALAEEGYVVMCPDVFWRVEPNIELAHDADGLQQAFGFVQRFSEVDPALTRSDLAAALDHLKRLPEVTGLTAAMGYCLGGGLAYELAAGSDPACCVSYYGSSIAGHLEVADAIACPILFHFGSADPYISAEDVERIRQAFAARSDVEIHVQPEAGHAFENSFAAQFSNPEAARHSWPRTIAFLARWLNGDRPAGT